MNKNEKNSTALGDEDKIMNKNTLPFLSFKVAMQCQLAVT